MVCSKDVSVFIKETWSTLKEAVRTILEPSRQAVKVPSTESFKQDTAKPPYYEEIIELLADHPEGLSLVEIGGKLNVEWRLLTKTIKQLLEDEKIIKEDRTYYPKPS